MTAPPPTRVCPACRTPLPEAAVKIPYYLTPTRLRIDPDFAPLKGNPRFEKLLQGS